MNTILKRVVWVVLGVMFAQISLAETGSNGAKVPEKPPAIPTTSTADHSTFEALKGPFASGPEVTKACLTCHNEADDQIMHSIHFNWNYESASGQTLGKSKVINAFCGNVAGNEPRCTSCHAGYGWDDMSVTPADAGVAPDCLVCHDRSGQYTKTATGAGHPPLDPVKPGTKTITGQLAWAVDLAKSAQSVAMPGRDNCGNCHFYGGGGDNVKHGDLSSALYNPSKQVDVHMSPEGENFTCSTCHVEEKHDWAGSRYDTVVTLSEHPKPGAGRTTATCESCHSDAPHPLNIKGVKLNDHTDKLACQTCHIPEFARGGVATKTYWDWSAAGRMGPDGKPMHEDNWVQSDGKKLHTYLSTKGIFDYGEDVVPHYDWFNGHVEYATDEVIDPSKVVEVNRLNGTPGATDSRIWPFKRMEGRQAYDTASNKLTYSQVWGPTTDTAFWTNFDWGKAIKAGMKAAGREYSGQFDFTDTYMYWPITHMVAPADQALDCAACHAEDGRLDGIAAVYMPGTDPRGPFGLIGMAIFALALLGVTGHALLRLVGRKSKGTPS
ncbi:tetrathionate reductase family octaheme c-type cytochrome [Aliiroseovarius crassostreae]|uniref:tetrathionate reductase family octaheme c-type cytochrome n=1 Tax=Aliiroseovarius crassostreae TaxID=154981 RepID=UPI0021AF9572|nr:tetrathionate reductase family octaheme c-type cytochrome [Aliiroseovarius crassostreae]UWP90168.1 tetrathionate reductase family octaheme c-type cytochrome [Aliiroseovarius crassostreae]UWQ02821.1 tetrathionate reductase family octaheme c-type cytochrome [Aliiroseovarius crassostreae]